jgi:hypothetical protein
MNQIAKAWAVAIIAGIFSFLYLFPAYYAVMKAAGTESFGVTLATIMVLALCYFGILFLIEIGLLGLLGGKKCQ